MAASLHEDLTPQQESLLARSGPVTPNHEDLITEISVLQADASLDPAAKGYQLAEAATRAQAKALHVRLDAAPLAGHETPSAALLALAHDAGVTLSPEDLQEARALDQIPAEAAGALARVIDAYASMNRATAHALAQNPTTPDWGETLAARLQLLSAVHAFRELVPEGLPGSPKAAAYFLYNIDLSPASNTYTLNYALSLDAAGNDVYQNNAGGNWIGNCGIPTAASAFIDLAGSDTYAPAYPHTPGGPPYADSCGKVGGAKGGVGFLLDHGGFNRFGAGQSEGVNGGAVGPALGFLLSLDGVNNEYTASCTGTNGGASNGGVGLLIDASLTSNSIRGGCQGSNGGAHNTGVGMLINTAGGTHTAGSTGTNGGGANGGIGFAYGAGDWNAGSEGTNGGGSNGYGTLVGASGSWAGGQGTNGGATGTGSTGYMTVGYLAQASDIGTNGGGANGGHGTLLASDCICAGGSYGTNGGGYNTGIGFLASATGYFSAGSNGVNGGADESGIGFLAVSGHAYVARDRGTNGGGTFGGVGLLIDTGGNAEYRAGSQGVNGGGYAGNGLLIDAGGDDAYVAGSEGANGGAMASGSGTLIDLTGNDAYTCSNPACNGNVVGITGLGLLLDVQGADAYNGNTNWSTQTLVPNGIGGARIDLSPI